MDGCLSCWRWCCCVYIVVLGTLGGLIGLLFAVSGGVLLWGTTVMNSLSASVLKTATDQIKASLNVEFDLQAFYEGISVLATSLAIFLLIFGIVLLIISCLGCWGACCGVPACLIVHSVFIGILFVAEIVIIIMWFSNRNTFQDGVKTMLDSQVKGFKGIRGSNTESLVMNLMQIYLGCCGVTNGSDYTEGKAAEWNRTYTMNSTYTFNLTYPVSCCKFDTSNFKLQDEYCPYNGTEDTSNFNVGCYSKVMLVANNAFQFDNFFFGLIGWAVLELLLILGSILICLAVRRSRQANKPEDYKMQMQPMA